MARVRVVAGGPRRRDIGIEVDDRGLPDGEPLLMIMGLGMQLTGWPDELVQMLVSRGFRVLRFDNRDIGLSQYFDHLGVPNLAWAACATRWACRCARPTAWPTWRRRAGRAGRAGHCAGPCLRRQHGRHDRAAPGGPAPAAREEPDADDDHHRLAPACRSPGLRVRRALLSRPRSAAPEDVASHLRHVLGGHRQPGLPAGRGCAATAPAGQRAACLAPAGTARQIVAVVADGDRSPLLPRIQARTCIIHGEADPLVPVAAGRDLLARIAGAVGDFIPGMGHDLPAQLLPRFADSIAANARR
jgi:pimeloyl-ACP methyl ester carboxylesterase